MASRISHGGSMLAKSDDFPAEHASARGAG
jgi:hypothetical protein